MTYLRYIAIFALTAAAAAACGRLYARREDKWSIALRSLAAALVTYIFVQSGVARRLTWEALLPAWGGAAYPGRTAVSPRQSMRATAAAPSTAGVTVKDSSAAAWSMSPAQRAANRPIPAPAGRPFREVLRRTHRPMMTRLRAMAAMW